MLPALPRTEQAPRPFCCGRREPRQALEAPSISARWYPNSPAAPLQLSLQRPLLLLENRLASLGF